MSSKTAAENFKVICSKDNMLLRKNIEMKLFSLEYTLQNPNCNITSLLNVNISPNIGSLASFPHVDHDNAHKGLETTSNPAILHIYAMYKPHQGISSEL